MTNEILKVELNAIPLYQGIKEIYLIDKREFGLVASAIPGSISIFSDDSPKHPRRCTKATYLSGFGLKLTLYGSICTTGTREEADFWPNGFSAYNEGLECLKKMNPDKEGQELVLASLRSYVPEDSQNGLKAFINEKWGIIEQKSPIDIVSAHNFAHHVYPSKRLMYELAVPQRSRTIFLGAGSSI